MPARIPSAFQDSDTARRIFAKVSTAPEDRLRARFPRYVWALDFAFNQTAGAWVLKVPTLTDEFTKKALTIEVEWIHHG